MEQEIYKKWSSLAVDLAYLNKMLTVPVDEASDFKIPQIRGPL